MPTPLTRRRLAIGTLSLVIASLAVVAAAIASSRAAQAQPNPSILAQQPPASCACAPAVPIFGGSGGPQIASCQCGGLNCAAATAAGAVVLQCAR
ncbi:MAG TPA: hypothetical protein VML58_02375 [Burkholderiaceae bacterium]|nr:hypothetical protein [Burkholderiaceae bacterium]